MQERLLLLDIGSGTQDVLLWSDETAEENCPKFILPSPARMVDAAVRRHTAGGRHIHLAGTNMGGGFYWSIKNHLEAGLRVSATPEAALALGDDPARVEGMGITLSDSRPHDHALVELADFSFSFWRTFLGAAGLECPDTVLAAAQDHGYHPGSSNRLGRFRIWRDLLQGSEPRRLETLVFETPPENLTRLATIRRATHGGLTSDTGTAAVLGALYDPEVLAANRRQGITVINLGNSHTLAFRLFEEKIYGVFEHHTGIMDASSLRGYLGRFRRGGLSNEEVFDANGHGCLVLDAPEKAGDFAPTFIIGPRRAMLTAEDGVFPAPGGDMMLAGAFGLLQAWRMKQGDAGPM